MNYEKKPISIIEQVKKLKSRGLLITDECKAAAIHFNVKLEENFIKLI